MTISTDSTPNRARRKAYIVAGFITAVVAAVAIFLATRTSLAPEVQFTTITGERISTSDLRGKVVLVNFWATSCTTCVKEMPQMVDTYQRYRDQGFEFIAVAMQYDPPNYVLNYAESRRLPFKVALDITGNAAQQFGNVQLTPTTFMLDKQGRIVKRYLGEPDFNALHRLIEKKLAT